jgi:hypothetical protein
MPRPRDAAAHRLALSRRLSALCEVEAEAGEASNIKAEIQRTARALASVDELLTMGDSPCV